MRDVVLLRKDVAPLHWHRSWTELVADAEGDVDGIDLAQQPESQGIALHEWTEGPKDAPVRKQIAPPGWACFYRGPNDRPFLHFQNY